MTNGELRSTTRPRMSDDHALRVLYFGTFAGAAIGSLVLSAFGLPWFPALWAVGWMLAYLFIARNRAPDHVQTEEFGDNYYYFGFLLTLVSLCGVLVQLGLEDQGMTDNLLRLVLSQFGLALITTILGLVVRTILLMHRRTLDDIEGRAEAQMAQAFDSFVHSLNRLSAEADTFSQGFGERLRTILTNVEMSVGEFGDVVRSTTAHVIPLQSDLGTASSALRDSSGAIKDATGNLVGELESSTASVRSAFTDLGTTASQAIQELSYGAMRLRETVEAAGGAIGQPLTSLEAHVSSFGRQIDQIASSLRRFPDELVGAAASAGNSLAPLNAQVEDLRQSVGQIEGALRSIASGIEGEGVGISSSVRSLHEQIETLAGIHARLSEESEGASRALVQVRGEMAAGVDFLINALQAAGSPDNPAES